MTNPKTPSPALLAWACRALGARPVVQDASHSRENSRVWQLSLPGDVRFYLKVSPRPLMYERETLALRHAVPALGAGRAPQLRASSAERLALLLTAVPGRPLKQLTLTPAEEVRAHRHGGALLARLHAAGDLSGPRRAEAEQALQSAADGAAIHLREAGDRVTPAEQKLVRDLAEQLRSLPPLPLAFIHGDAWERNLLWSKGMGQAGWVDFERARFAAAVQDFVLMACTTWADRPDLRAACLQGYGRDLTPEEQHALKCLAVLDAVSCLVCGPKPGVQMASRPGRGRVPAADRRRPPRPRPRTVACPPGGTTAHWAAPDRPPRTVVVRRGNTAHADGTERLRRALCLPVGGA